MPFLRAGDIVTHYRFDGPPEAPVVLLANSLGTNFHMWDAQAAVLSRHYRVLRYDMRGHGLSDATPPGGAGPGYTLDQLAQDALGLLDGLAIDRVHFCGLSIGGMVAQRCTALAPARVASLILCDTASRIGPPSLWDDRVAAIGRAGLAGIRDGVLARWFTEDFRRRHPVELQGFGNMLVRTPAEGYVGCCLAIRDADLRPCLAAIKCPTLVIVGDQDLATPPALARELHDGIAGSQFAVIDNAAHVPAVEQPEALNALLAGFLGRQG
jgi:3-oxoadipate enol-lactonase